MNDGLPLSEVAQRRLARMVLAGWRFKPRKVAVGVPEGTVGWECTLPDGVPANVQRRFTSWTLGGLVQRQWKIYQRWMHTTQ